MQHVAAIYNPNQPRRFRMAETDELPDYEFDPSLVEEEEEEANYDWATEYPDDVINFNGTLINFNEFSDDEESDSDNESDDDALEASINL